MRTCTKLKRLVLTVALKNDLVDILNKNLCKDVGLKSLQITFAAPGGGTSSEIGGGGEIKFHKYIKNLRSLSVLNIGDKNFSENMFDMASIRKLKELNLSFVPEL